MEHSIDDSQPPEANINLRESKPEKLTHYEARSSDSPEHSTYKAAPDSGYFSPFTPSEAEPGRSASEPSVSGGRPVAGALRSVFSFDAEDRARLEPNRSNSSSFSLLNSDQNSHSALNSNNEGNNSHKPPSSDTPAHAQQSESIVGEPLDSRSRVDKHRSTWSPLAIRASACHDSAWQHSRSASDPTTPTLDLSRSAVYLRRTASRSAPELQSRQQPPIPSQTVATQTSTPLSADRDRRRQTTGPLERMLSGQWEQTDGTRRGKLSAETQTEMEAAPSTSSRCLPLARVAPLTGSSATFSRHTGSHQHSTHQPVNSLTRPPDHLFHTLQRNSAPLDRAARNNCRNIGRRLAQFGDEMAADMGQELEQELVALGDVVRRILFLTLREVALWFFRL